MQNPFEKITIPKQGIIDLPKRLAIVAIGGVGLAIGVVAAEWAHMRDSGDSSTHTVPAIQEAPDLVSQER